MGKTAPKIVVWQNSAEKMSCSKKGQLFVKKLNMEEHLK